MPKTLLLALLSIAVPALGLEPHPMVPLARRLHQTYRLQLTLQNLDLNAAPVEMEEASCAPVIAQEVLPAPASESGWLNVFDKLLSNGAPTEQFGPDFIRALAELPFMTRHALLRLLSQRASTLRKNYLRGEVGITPRRASDVLLGVLFPPYEFFQLRLGKEPVTEIYDAYLQRVQSLIGKPNAYGSGFLQELTEHLRDSLLRLESLAVRLDTWGRSAIVWRQQPLWQRLWNPKEAPQALLDSESGFAPEFEEPLFLIFGAILRRLPPAELAAYLKSEPLRALPTSAHILITGSFPNGRAVYARSEQSALTHGSDIDLRADIGLGFDGFFFTAANWRANVRGASLSAFLNEIPLSPALGNPLSDVNHPAVALSRQLSPIALKVARDKTEIFIFPTDGSQKSPLVLELPPKS